jgi:hypothetical protein
VKQLLNQLRATLAKKPAVGAGEVAVEDAVEVAVEVAGFSRASAMLAGYLCAAAFYCPLWPLCWCQQLQTWQQTHQIGMSVAVVLVVRPGVDLTVGVEVRMATRAWTRMIHAMMAI